MATSAQRSALQAKHRNIEFLDKGCEFCGRSFVVNNYEDHKARTPKIFGMIICPNCDPREMTTRWDKSRPTIRAGKEIQYRTIVSVVVAKRVARELCPLEYGSYEDTNGCMGKCTHNIAEKVWPE